MNSKKNTIFGKFVFTLNSILCLFLFSCYIINNFYLDILSDYSLISVFYPQFFILNLLFLIYWILKFDFRFILSLVFLFISISNPIYLFNSNSYSGDNNLSQIMSYNVRLFNHYNWINSESIPSKISNFIKSKNPDILCFQEYHNKNIDLFKDYSEVHLGLNGENVGLAIFSKEKIIDKGDIRDSKGKLLAIYVDLKIKNDTIRVYNTHLKSYNLDLLSLKADKKSIKEIFDKSRNVYQVQNNQSELILNHIKKSKFPIILSVDLNNTPYSFVYKKFEENYDDSFVENGNGFGSTFGSKILPMRIDYIFKSSSITSKKFIVYDVKFSDHKPISMFF